MRLGLKEAVQTSQNQPMQARRENAATHPLLSQTQLPVLRSVPRYTRSALHCTRALKQAMSRALAPLALSATPLGHARRCLGSTAPLAAAQRLPARSRPARLCVRANELNKW